MEIRRDCPIPRAFQKNCHLSDFGVHYRLAVPSPGIYHVVLSKYAADEQMTAIDDEALVVEAGKVTSSSLRLLRRRSVTGKVVDAAGKPVANVQDNLHQACHAVAAAFR